MIYILHDWWLYTFHVHLIIFPWLIGLQLSDMMKSFFTFVIDSNQFNPQNHGYSLVFFKKKIWSLETEYVISIVQLFIDVKKFKSYCTLNLTIDFI